MHLSSEIPLTDSNDSNGGNPPKHPHIPNFFLQMLNATYMSNTWQLIFIRPVDSRCCTMAKWPVLAARWRHVEPSTSLKKKETGCDQCPNRVNVPPKAFDYRMLY